MSKYVRNNVKLFAIVSIMAGVLAFSPVFSTVALAEDAEVAGASTTTEAVATTTEATTTIEATTTNEAATTSEATSATESAATTESSAPVVSTDDDSDEDAVKSYIDNNYYGLTRELHISVSTDGGTYNGKSYIPPTISDDAKSVSFSSHVQREGYTLVGFTTDYWSAQGDATPDMSMPYTIDADGMVHMNFSDLHAWSSLDNIDTGIITSRYHLFTLWAPNPEPEPTPASEPQAEPASDPEPQSQPTTITPASDKTQQPAPRREKSVLPNTGDVSSVAGVVAAAGTALVALGLRKKF